MNFIAKTRITTLLRGGRKSQLISRKNELRTLWCGWPRRWYQSVRDEIFAVVVKLVAGVGEEPVHS